MKAMANRLRLQFEGPARVVVGAFEAGAGETV